MSNNRPADAETNPVFASFVAGILFAAVVGMLIYFSLLLLPKLIQDIPLPDVFWYAAFGGLVGCSVLLGILYVIFLRVQLAAEMIDGGAE